VVRCSWCEREASGGVESFAPYCAADACAEATYWLARGFLGATWRHSAEVVLTIAQCKANAAADAVVEARDAAEQRGEPPSLDGWTLFDAGPT